MIRGLLLSIFFFASYFAQAQQYGWLQTIRPGGDEYCWDVATDALGYVYATGRVKAFSDFGTPGNMQSPPPIGVTESDVFLVKYSPNGSLVWARRHGGYEPDWGRQVTVDKYLNPIIVGDYCDTAHFGSVFLDAVGAVQNRNIFVAKYDSAGTCLWAKSAGHASNYSRAYGVCTDEAANVYVTGHVAGPTNFNGVNFGINGLNVPFIAKFKADGTCVWARHVSCQYGGEGYDICYRNGKLFVTGTYRGTMTISAVPYAGNSSSWGDVFTMRLDTNNVVDWVRTATGDYQDNPLGMDIDDDGNVYIGGLFANDLTFAGNTIYSMTMGTNATQANNYHGSFLAKYDVNGNFQWVRSLTSPKMADINDVEVTHSGKVLIAAFVVDTFYTDGQQFPFDEANVNALVTCYDANGNWMWNKLTGAGANNGASAYGICNDAHDNIFVGGKYLGPSCDFDGFSVVGGALWDAYIAKLYPPIDPVIGIEDTLLCEGDSTKMFVQQDGWPLTISWNLPGANPATSANDTVTAIYAMSGTYNGNISLSFPVMNATLPIPAVTVSSEAFVNLGNNTSVCPGETILLDAGSGFASYTWNSGDTAQQIMVADGTFMVEVDNGSGCMGSDTIVIGTHNVNAPFIGSDTVLCAGETLLLNAGTYVAYQWSTSDTTATVLASLDGMYSVEVTDGNGCTSADTITIAHFAAIDAGLGNDTTVCEQQQVILQASSGFTQYSWSTTETNNSISVTAPGFYWVMVTDVNNCADTDTILVSNFAQVFPDLGMDSTICDDEFMTLNAGSGYVSYVWSDGSVLQTFTVTDSAYYWVTVTDANGCVMSDTVQVYEQDCSGIAESVVPVFHVYPNPAHDVIYISSDQLISRVDVYNTLGEPISHTDFSSGKLVLPNLSPGMYQLVVFANEATYTMPVIIE